MPDENKEAPASKEHTWTIMFFFASDNSLSPLLMSQVRAIKDAGFLKNAEVLVYFDSNERGVPTRIYNINQKRKNGGSKVGDGRDPFIHHIGEDDLLTLPDSAPIKAVIDKLDKATAAEALQAFLKLGLQRGSNHYMLFLIGHGMIVANDRFLPDENPVSAITLSDLDKFVREGFAKKLNDDQTLELLAMQSCSMSAIEVAYQLKGTAKYMLASQGLSFVGSWPYRQLMKKTFNSIEDGEKPVELMNSILHLSMHNGTDFMAAGYSSELCLTDLNSNALESLGEEIAKFGILLSYALRSEEGQPVKPLTDAILLSHWKAQSFWQEEYTDLSDFCRCLRLKCEHLETAKDLRTACDGVEKGIASLANTRHFGWRYQYSRGLSIYFPWSEPIEDVNDHVLKNYEKYQFTIDFKKGDDRSWLNFLRTYWRLTKRESREEEDNINVERRKRFLESGFVNPVGSLSGDPNKPVGSHSGDPNKTSGASGDGCTCPSIKNYPTEDFDVKGGRFKAPKISISDDIFDHLI